MTGPVSSASPAALRWREALASWAIPDEILARAEVAPWAHPPALFTVAPPSATGDDELPDTPSMRVAADALLGGGSVLDVGCGGGGSSIPLGNRITSLTGVDEQQEMLERLRSAAEVRSIPVATVQGRWPDVADAVGVHDLVVCHHVAYNVPDIDPFVRALTGHARRRVVVELPDRHPLSALNPLWKRFWDLDRPTEPSADLFVDVVRATGAMAHVESFRRAGRPSRTSRADLVRFTRQRLCLPVEREQEVDAALGDTPVLSPDTVVTVWWDT